MDGWMDGLDGGLADEPILFVLSRLSWVWERGANGRNIHGIYHQVTANYY